MAKAPVLNNIDNESVPAGSSTVNANNDAIETAFENTLSRDGSSPNQMEAPLDMNGFKILNIAAPTEDTDLVRMIDRLEGPKGDKGDPGPTGDGTGDMLASNNLSDVDDVDTAQQNLNLEPGVDILEYDTRLQAFADFAPANYPAIPYLVAASSFSEITPTSLGINILEASLASDIRTVLGLGNSATRS